MTDQKYDPEAILADSDSHFKHKETAAINIRVRDHGEQWQRCANCGQAYPLEEEWQDITVCSRICWQAYLRYINEEV